MSASWRCLGRFSRMNRKTTVFLRALLASGVIIGLARADVINWTSSDSGIWNDPFNWDALQPPGHLDDAEHLKMLNHIQVAGNRYCLSFEGTSGVVDRFLLITSGHILTPREGGLHKSTGPGTPLANFVVKMENGSAGDETIVSVDGVTDGIDFVPAPKQKGDYLRQRTIDGRHFYVDNTVVVGRDSVITPSETVHCVDHTVSF